MPMNSQTSFASSTASSSSTDAATALHILLSPDGYYTYLGISKPQQPNAGHPPQPSNSTNTHTHSSKYPQTSGLSGGQLQDFDKAVIQKNYRRLSLRLHPDRPTGDEEAFRVLERAKNVLLNDKLRKQYDLLGLDLEDDDYHDESHQEDEYGNTVDDLKKDDDRRRGGDLGENSASADGTSGGGSSSSGGGGGTKEEKSNGVLSHMAGATVAALLQLAVRTGMMAITSVIITRWKYTTIPAVLFLLYTSFQIFRAKSSGSSGVNLIQTYDILSPILLATGLIIMYTWKNNSHYQQQEGEVETQFQWNKMFWMGETLIMTIFCINTLVSKEASSVRPSLGLGVGLYVFFAMIALFIRGKGWRYMTILSMELGLALVAVLVFPIMEMIMEALVDEKMKKVGERVRLYARVMEEHHRRELEELERKLACANSACDGSSRVGGAAGVGKGTHAEELD